MKTAFVTGATSGFGRAICIKLIEAGYKVIGTGRRTERLAELHSQLGNHFLPLAFDIRNEEATKQALASLPEGWQAVDLLVNNAGLALGLELTQFSLNLRADLAGTKVRVSNVEPGLCGGTEFSNVRFRGDDEKAAEVYKDVQSIQPEDIANIVLWLNQQPEHVNINRIEVMPVAQTFAGLKVAKNL